MSSSTPNSSVSNMACLPEVDPELVAFGEDHTGVAMASQQAAAAARGRNNNGSASCSTVSTSSCTPSPPSMLPVHHLACPPPPGQQQQRVVPNLRMPAMTSSSPPPTAQQPSGALYGVSNGQHQLASRGEIVTSPSNAKFPPPMPINSEYTVFSI